MGSLRSSMRPPKATKRSERQTGKLALRLGQDYSYQIQTLAGNSSTVPVPCISLDPLAAETIGQLRGWLFDKARRPHRKLVLPKLKIGSPKNNHAV
jgi:hypothetical protein